MLHLMDELLGKYEPTLVACNMTQGQQAGGVSWADTPTPSEWRSK